MYVILAFLMFTFKYDMEKRMHFFLSVLRIVRHENNVVKKLKIIHTISSHPRLPNQSLRK